jgi:alpha-galactosidase
MALTRSLTIWHRLLMFACLLPTLTHSFADLHAGTPGELVLDAAFRVRQMTEMPAPVVNPEVSFSTHQYSEYAAIEWQVRLQGLPTTNPGLHENLRSADFVVSFPSEASPILHWSQGSHAEPSDFRPRADPLAIGQVRELESFGGRSSDGVMPYFNVASEGGGLIVAIGWSGDWRASFESLGEGRVRIMAGLKRSRFKLPVGETLRLPSVLVMAYQGTWLDGQNQFRRLMLEQFTPPGHPPLLLMPVAASVHGMLAFNDTTASNLIDLAREIAALKLPIDTFWLDAGWNEGGFPGGQGNPQPDPVRFPQGLAPVGQAARGGGLRFLAWFEPERAMRGTWLHREHPDWLLRPSETPEALRYQEHDGFHLLDLGNATARQWALATISQQIRDAGVDIYRQDFNEYPAYFWQTGEAADQLGLREVRYINGLYDLLDELIRQNPGLIIDSCASGGRRLDFEMMRRSVSLWRSDSCWDDRSSPRNMQAMTHGLSLWLPLHGLGAAAADDTSLRSGMGACASFAINYRDPLAVASLREHLDRYLPLRAIFTADFYPLTPWSDNPAEWLAFQFHDRTKGAGVVQAFCGPSGSARPLRLKFRGLVPEQQYAVTDWDSESSVTVLTGAELADPGLEIQPRVNAQQCRVFHYVPAPD